MALEASSDSASSPSMLGSARTEVLENPDIMCMVFGHLSFDLQTPPADILRIRKDWLSMALVCQAFLEPALDALWRILPSLLPLLRLLPSFGLENNIYMLDDLDEDDWNRFDTHARRVRVLYILPTNITISSFVYQWLHLRTSSKAALLPALQELRVTDNASIDLLSMASLFPAQIRLLELNNNALSNSAFCIPFLNLLGTRSRTLKHLILRGSTVVPLHPITRFTRLESLELLLPQTYINPQLMEDLGNLEHLTSLRLDVGSALPTAVRLPLMLQTGKAVNQRRRGGGRGTQHFRGLKTLHLTGCPSSALRLLEHMKLDALTSFKLTEKSEPGGVSSSSFWSACFERLSASLHLCSVEIEQAPVARDAWGNIIANANPLSASILLSLITLPLESLTIAGDSFPATDDQFKSLTRQLTKLKKLILPPLGSSPSLRTIVNLTVDAPALEELQFCLANDISALGDIEVAPNSTHPLKKLSISSPLGQLRPLQLIQMSKLLHSAFPNLLVIEAFGPYINQESWKEVQEFYMALREASARGHVRS